MELDFHYYAIRAITQTAGFSPHDSQIIAYASQFVDDAVDHHKMKVSGDTDMMSERYDGKHFDPVCTAHRGVQFIQSLQESVQRKIYLTYHFLPPLPYDPNSNVEFDYITQANSPFARILMQNAIINLAKADNGSRLRALIRLGIILHSFADTWAHQNFSGRLNEKENDIKRVQYFEDDEWKSFSFIKQATNAAFPNIGHAEANSFPDRSHLTWRFTNEESGEVFERKNPDLFIAASKAIYELLSGEKLLKNWKYLQDKLYTCFKYVGQDKIDKINFYKQTFPEIEFHYDPLQWRNEAIRVTEKPAIKLKNMDHHFQEFEFGADKKWFYFNMEALEHRNYIDTMLPKSIK